MPMRIKIGAPATGSDFFPRPQIEAKLLRAMQTEHVLFLAPRRTGKTSLILHLRDNTFAIMPQVLVYSRGPEPRPA